MLLLTVRPPYNTVVPAGPVWSRNVELLIVAVAKLAMTAAALRDSVLFPTKVDVPIVRSNPNRVATAPPSNFAVFDSKAELEMVAGTLR